MSRTVAFRLIAAAFLINMLGTTLPTPLYPIFEQTYGFGSLVVTIVFAVYAFGVLAGLLFFGHLSDEIGRRRVLIAGLLLSGASALAFLFARDLAVIFLGRILSGLSAGVFTGTATAALVDFAPLERRARATMIAVAVNIGGLGVGTLLSGLLGQYEPWPLKLTFAVDAVLVLSAIVAVFITPEPIATTGTFSVRLQPLRIPAEIRSVFLQAAVIGMCGFAVAGLFSAVAPSFLATILGEKNHAFAGLLVFAMMSMVAVGQIVVRRFARRDALQISCAILMLGTALLATSLQWHLLGVLFLSAVLEGLGAGLGIGSGLAEINERITERRGEVSSAYFVLLYIGLAFPVIGVGLLSTAIGLGDAGLVFCAVILVALAGVLLYTRSQAPGLSGRRPA
jgi:MFS family permease